MAAQTMVANTYDRHFDISGWFTDLRAELPDSSFYLHVVLKCGEEKTRGPKRFWLKGSVNLSRWKTTVIFNQALKSPVLYAFRVYFADYIRMYEKLVRIFIWIS